MLSFLFRGYLEDGEKIYFIAHRHPFIFLKGFVKYGFWGMLLPLFLFWLFPEFFIFAAIWFFLGCLRFLYELIDWYFDAWVLTSNSVVDIQWEGFFTRTSTRIEYHMIEGVYYEYRGVVQTLFRYGDIVIQKIGSGMEVALRDAILPKKIESQVLKLQLKFVTDKSYKEHDALKSLLSDMLQEHAKKSR